MTRRQRSARRQYDYLIIGAGPAGLQLGYYLKQAGRNYLILEKGDSPGMFFRTFPRHRRLLSINKIYTGYDDPERNMRWDWNSLLSDRPEMLFKHYSRRYFPDADDLVRYLGDFAAAFDLKIEYGVEIVSVSKDDRFHLLDSQGNTYSCRCLIIATGLLHPYIPPISGIELAERYTDVSIDPEDFVNQRVLIIGKGNAGFETADNLIETTAAIHLVSPGTVKLAWKHNHVGYLRAVNNNLLDTYLLKSQNGLLDAQIERIERRDGQFVAHFSFTRAHGSRMEGCYDRVILCAGFRFDDSPFDETCRPALVMDGRFPEQTGRWESVNIKDLYFAGTLMQMRDYKQAQSAFIHGFRFNLRTLHRILEQEYHGQELPSRTIDLSVDNILSVVCERINRSAALWQQPGYLCDLMVVSERDGTARYYRELPVDYVRETQLGHHQQSYVVTLEFGPDYPDYPFLFNRYTEPSQAHLNPQLHPVIRRFDRAELVGEQHILEDLEGRWVQEIHLRPLREFFERHLPA